MQPFFWIILRKRNEPGRGDFSYLKEGKSFTLNLKSSNERIVDNNFQKGEAMKVCKATVVLVLLTWLAALPARSHFGMVIPSDSMVVAGDSRTVTLTLSFAHPFEMVGMDLVKPKMFKVVKETNQIDLLGLLEATQVMGHTAWKAAYPLKRPGVYMFYMEPQPYWEPAEDSFIIHYTKTVVTAYGDDEGWDAEIGLKTEIVPLSKPFGLYAGNIFQGIVKLNGKPVPFAEVEVEYYNVDRKYTAPTEYMITQTIKADKNGVFSYAAPVSGWWGFAALNGADYRLPRDGEKKEVELGAVIWVYFHEMK
jgi:cobalt/nickel transport protein